MANGPANKKAIEGLVRETRAAPDALFLVEPDWHTMWWGMPSFEHGDARPAHRVTINFLSSDDLADFARATGLSVSPRTDSVWFPAAPSSRSVGWEYVDEDEQPDERADEPVTTSQPSDLSTRLVMERSNYEAPTERPDDVTKDADDHTRLF